MEEYFPKSLKPAKVVCLFKSGDMQDSSYNCPISVLPSIRQNVERIMYTKVESFLETIKQTTKRQFGLRKKLSTRDALISTTENRGNHLNNNMHVACAFLDLSNASDTVKHKIFLKKNYGIRGIA